MDHAEILDKKYGQRLEKIDHNINLALSDIANCIKSFLPNTNKTERSVKNKSIAVKELVPFIQNILHFFHSFPNDKFEELLLPHIGELRQQNSLPLIDNEPLNPCPICEWDENDNFPSKDTITPDVPPTVAWEMLCWHLEKYIQKQISSQTVPTLYDPKMNRRTWQYYLQKLNNIMATSRLWEFHIHLRIYQLDYYTCPCFPNSNLFCLDCLIATCINNFLEDTKFVTTGTFSQLVITREDFYTVYTQRISDFVRYILDNIEAYNKSPPTNGLIRQLKCFHSISHSWCKTNLITLLNVEKMQNTSDKFKFPESILLEIVETLLVFERKTSGVLNKASQSYLNLNDLLMSLPSESPEQSPMHQSGTKTKNKGEIWNWRNLIVEKGFLNLLQRTLHTSVSESVMELCTKEFNIFIENNTLDCVEISEEHFGYRVMKSAVKTIQLLDSYKPLLEGSSQSLFPFCASFCHVIHTYLVDLIDHIKKVSENSSMECCYLSLYTCVYLIEKLSVYSNYCGCGAKNESQLQILISTVECQLLEWIDYLKLRISTFHIQGTICGILHDSDSNNWAENKSFFENERVSHCLNVWNIYTKRIMCDMKQCLPPEISHELFSRIFCESIDHLTKRYSRVKPSESRTTQLRVDITFVLLCVSEYLPHICTSLNEYLGTTDTPGLEKISLKTREIHSNSCSLLMVLAIVTSPLGALCKIYKNGFPQLPDGVENEADKYTCNWLTWVHPVLFRKSKDGNLISSANVWFSTTISNSKYFAVPSLVLNSLTLHTCTLSILLITQASKLPKEQDNLKYDLALSILTILKYASHKPSYLGLVIIPVINSCEEWETFDGPFVITSSSVTKPWWYTALIDIIHPFMNDLIGTTLTDLLRLATSLDAQSMSDWKTIYLHLRQVVRCSCNEIQVINRETAIFLLSLKLLQSLVESISTIPQTILFAIIQLQEHLIEINSNAKPIRNSVGLQILVDIVYSYLKSDKYLEECLGLKPTKAINRMCQDVADCLISLIASNEKYNHHSIPLWCINESNQSLIQIESIFQGKLDKPNFQYDSDEQENITQMLIDILQDKRGLHAIKRLHKIIKKNAKWIRKSLGIPAILSSDLVVSSVCPSPLPMALSDAFKIKGDDSESLFIPEEDSYKENWLRREASPPAISETLNLDNVNEIKSYNLINIIEEFDKIGDELFSYETIANIKYFWDALLSHLPLLGLTEEGFKGLLANRWDINNEKLLSESEKSGVQILRKQYDLNKLQKPPQS